QTFAIVRDQENRTWISSQIFLEPLERFEIEMIRRFVEQKQIGFHHKQPREMSAHDPAATQSARRAIKIGLAKREPGQDSFCFRLELPAAVLIKNMERIMIDNVVQSLPGLVLLDHFLRVHKLG